MQVRGNEEDQAVSLENEYKRVLSLLHTIDTKNNKQQENEKFSNPRYHVQDMKDVQHKNINMYWGCRNFLRQPVAAEEFKMRGINIILSHYY